MRKVFLDELPRKEGVGVNKGKMVIDWQNSIGYKVSFVYDDIEGEIVIVNYKKKENKLTIKYKDDTFFDIKTGVFLRCSLGKMLGRHTNEFKVRIGEIFKDDKRDLIITDREYRFKEQKPDKKGRVYTTREKWYKYTCNICGWTEGWIVEGNLTKGQGCSCCTNKTAVLGINTIWDTDRWMVDLGVSEEDAKKYVRTSNQKITVICPNCNVKKKIQMWTICIYKSIGCACGDGFSYPEKLVANILMQLNIKFETQYSPDYLVRVENNKKSRKYSDFLLPEYNLVVETDGSMNHKGGKVHSKAKRTLEEYIEIDKWKDRQHKLHGIETVRIDCFESNMEYIKNNILKSKLKEMFDLSKVDWNKCEEFALGNRVKDVCEYWNRKEDWESTTTIAENNEWNIKGVSTIIEYLKKGNKLGWCDYNPKEEMKKNGSKNGKSQGKPVEIFKDNESLGVFESASELERQSEKLFGVKLYIGNISAVCLKKKKQYKGFIFRYIENNSISC